MEIKKICVVGTGVMAKGIVQTFAQAGYPVIVKGRPGKIGNALRQIGFVKIKK
jgi:3-hydroxybutyryl-CoA dehydrogenase